jgi:F-type H+-transporting ATPase subunit delta
MATISNNNIARAIYLSSKDKTGQEQETVIKNVINFLVRRKLISRSKDILTSLKAIIYQEQGVLEIKVWSKEKINEENKKDLIQILKKRYGDKKFILQENLDDKLLGGLKIEVNNESIDLTLRNKINKLQEYLIKNHE